MEGRRDGWREGWLGGWMGRLMEVWMNRWMDEPVSIQMGEQERPSGRTGMEKKMVKFQTF